jgi:hypothetical protein
VQHGIRPKYIYKLRTIRPFTRKTLRSSSPSVPTRTRRSLFQQRSPSVQQCQRSGPRHCIDNEPPIRRDVVLKPDQCGLDDTHLRKQPAPPLERFRVELDRDQLLVRRDEEQLSTIATPPRLSTTSTRDDQAGVEDANRRVELSSAMKAVISSTLAFASREAVGRAHACFCAGAQTVPYFSRDAGAVLQLTGLCLRPAALDPFAPVDADLVVLFEQPDALRCGSATEVSFRERPARTSLHVPLEPSSGGFRWELENHDG